MQTRFRTLYEFSIPREELVDDPQVTTDANGQEVTTIRKVKKAVDVPYCLQKPTRSLIDDAELFYNVTVSKGIQAGLFSAALLAKRFTNDGGILSETEKETWANKFLERVKKESEIQRLAIKDEPSRTEEEKARYDNLIKEIGELTRELQEFEVRQQALFDITAESRARTRTILWWLLFLLQKKNAAGEWEPFFAGKTLEEKQWSYDDLEDEEAIPDENQRKYLTRVVSHAVQAVALWYYGRATKQEEFKAELTAEPVEEPAKPAATIGPVTEVKDAATEEVKNE